MEQRLQRALDSLEGLSVGDAFGEQFFGRPETVLPEIQAQRLPQGMWHTSDDTEMATVLVDNLRRFGEVSEDALAAALAARHERDPMRGYGSGAHRLLAAIARGGDWRVESVALFGGTGSWGNGGAMRVAPLGAWFAGDDERVVREATRSAVVTHAHPEGMAGAVGVALAAARATELRGSAVGGVEVLDAAIAGTPGGATRDGLLRARDLGLDCAVLRAGRELGNGKEISSADTVPFAVWCAARHLASYEEAIWAAVSVLGDRDTICAIVGGIVACFTGTEGIPSAWLAAREPLRFESQT